MKTRFGVEKIAIAAMIASILLTACGTISKGNLSSDGESTHVDSRPRLKREYPCQNLHVKPSNCPPR